MRVFAKLLVYLALMFVGVIVTGEPDILDGWIKRANDVGCVELRR